MAAKSVFISSTSQDLKSHRDAVFEVVLQLKMRPIVMEYFGSNPGGAVVESLKQVADADYFVGIIAHRYGYVPASMDKSVTEQEYDEAGRLGIPRLMYIVDPTYDWPPERIENDPVAQARLQTFKAKIDQQNVRTLFTTPEKLASDVATDLARLDQEAREIRTASPRRNRLQTIATIVGILVGLVTIAGFLLSEDFRDLFRGQEVTTPDPMPPSTINSGLNVVIAAPGTQGADGTLNETDLSTDVGRNVYAQVKQMEDIANIRGPDDGVPPILNASRDERFTVAARIADELNADVVIFGFIEPIGDGSMSGDYTPEIYVSVSWATLEAEFLDAIQFGEPIQVLVGTNSDLEARIIALDLFLDGYSSFILGDYQTALTAFEKIINELQLNISVVYLYAGNAAARLEKFDAALDYYTRSLSLGNADYSRGLLGRASGLKHLIVRGDPSAPPAPTGELSSLTGHWPPGTTCLEPVDSNTSFEQWIELIFICLSEAEAVPNPPEVADVNLKIAFERGEIYAWLSFSGYREDWQLAQDDLQIVLDIYHNAAPDKQARTHLQAGLAHGFTAQIIVATGGDTQGAIDNYRSAIDILEQDINASYVNDILAGYRAALADLEAQMP